METSKKKEYDVRVVRFEKAVNRIDAVHTASASDWDYICLGHFDRVTAEALRSTDGIKRSPLQLICDNQKYGKSPNCQVGPQNGSPYDDNHVFSLYLLKETYTDHQFCDAFWKPDAKFCSIIRLHCELRTINQSSSSLLCYLEQYFQKLKNTSVKYVSAGKLKVCNTDVSYILYDSLELGDAVVVLKGASIVALLEVARWLNFNDAVRDTYTYCLIRSKLLTESKEIASSEVTEEKTSVEGDERPLVLNYAATRFAIRDAFAADEFLRDLGIKVDQQQSYPKAYFITGTTDLIVDWGPCTEALFLDYIRKIAQKGILSRDQGSTTKEASSETTPCAPSEATIQVAFNDVITRIGITYKNKEPHVSDPFKVPNTPSELACWSQFTFPSYLPFEASFRRMLGTLNSMYHNSVTDDLYNLLFPSTHAMLTRLTALKEAEDSSPKPWENMTREQWNYQCERYQADIIRYMEVWELLVGDITNLESQLVHQPELQVIRFYAPAMVLQFELEFAILCSKLLSGQNSRCFIPILALSQRTTVSTECLLDPFDEPYDSECALITQIPSEMLYDPWKAAHQLCHEVSHYCGDKSRRRKKRAEVLCKCMAEMVSRYWFSLYGNIVNTIKEENSILLEIRKYCIAFRDKLSSKLYHALGKDVDEYRLETVKSKLYENFDHICNDCELREEFQSHILSYFPADEQLAFLGKLATTNRETAYASMIELGLFKEHLEYLAHCLKECYADISMMLLLECSDKDYIQCVFEKEMKSLEDKFSGDWDGVPEENEEYTLKELQNGHIDRIALVYGARMKNHPAEDPQHRIGTWFAKLFARCLDRDNNSSTPNLPSALWENKAKTRAIRALSALQGDDHAFWEEDMEKVLPGHLFMFEATEIIKYLADCEKDLQKNLSANQTDIHKLRKALKAVHPNHFDWSTLQTFLNESRKKRANEYSALQENMFSPKNAESSYSS